MIEQQRGLVIVGVPELLAQPRDSPQQDAASSAVSALRDAGLLPARGGAGDSPAVVAAVWLRDGGEPADVVMHQARQYGAHLAGLDLPPVDVLIGCADGLAAARAVELATQALSDERVVAVVVAECPADGDRRPAAVVLARPEGSGRWPRVYAEILPAAPADSDGDGPAGIGAAAEAALRQARLRPAQVDYLDLAEGPAATAELASLVPVYGAADPDSDDLSCLLGSLGHRDGGAPRSGIGRLAALAGCLHGARLPAPPPGLDRLAADSPDIDRSVFAVAAGDQPWLPRTRGGRRVAALSAVADGDGAAHLLLAGMPASHPAGSPRRADDELPPMLLPVSGDSPAALADAAARVRREVVAGADPRSIIRTAVTAGHRSSRYRAVLVASGTDALLRELSYAERNLPAALDRAGEWATPAGSYCRGNPLPADGGVVFVYPGTYATYPGAGGDLLQLFPALRQRFEARAARPAEMLCTRQVFPRGRTVWDDAALARHERGLVADVASMMSAGVSLGVLHTWLLRDLLGIRPDAGLGYSLGEISMLFAHDVWSVERADNSSILNTPLFRRELHGPRTVVRTEWQLPADLPVDQLWATRVLFADAERAAAYAAELDRVFITHVNAPGEIVISGLPEQCAELTRRLDCPHVELPAAPVLHCPLVRPVFGKLHDVNAHYPAGRPDSRLHLFTADGFGGYPLDDEAAVARHVGVVLRDSVDFPRLVRTAYDQGHRYFIEVGPGALCSRWARDTLGDLPHVAVSVDRRDSPKAVVLAQALARLAGSGLAVDLTRLWAGDGLGAAAGATVSGAGQPPPLATTAAAPGCSQEGPTMIEPDTAPSLAAVEEELITLDGEVFAGPRMTERPPIPAPAAPAPAAPAPAAPAPAAPAAAAAQPVRLLRPGLADPLTALGAMVASAHRSALRAQTSVLEHSLRGLEAHGGLLPAGPAPIAVLPLDGPAGVTALISPDGPAGYPATRPGAHPGVLWDRADLVEFAEGSVAAVLGPRFAEVDTFAHRVRLPSPPYLFLTRVLSVDAQFGKYEPCTIVSECEVPGGIFAVDGQLRPAVLYELLQGCLPLLSFLGIDLVNRGRRHFRALGGATVFHGPMPTTGQTLRVESRITRFLWQGEQLLYSLDTRCLVGDELIQETVDAPFGLFTTEELENSGGIVDTETDRRHHAALTRRSFKPLARSERTSLSRHDLGLLTQGRLGEVFGPQWDQAKDGCNPSIRLPAGDMLFFDEVTSIDRLGGTTGLGEIIATKQVSPDDWYFGCHFPDDPVLPGSFCLEGVTQLLQIYAMYLGLHLVLPDTQFQPVPGLRSETKMRGQVTPGRSVVRCVLQVTSVELVDRPTIIADAMLYADDKPIMRVYDLGLQIREKPGTPYRPERGGRPARFLGRRNHKGQPALVNEMHLTHLAEGDTVIAAGPEFEVFRGRKIFRLPNGDFRFLDRIMDFTGERCDYPDGATFVTEYDCAPDAWYHRDNTLDPLPNFVLMEIALQGAAACGCYLGGSLAQPNEDMVVRNLDGRATLHRAVDLRGATIRQESEVVSTQHIQGVMIQRLRYRLAVDDTVFYSGETMSGLFNDAALANQTGLDGGGYVPPWLDSQSGLADRVRRIHPALDDSLFQPDPAGLSLPGGRLRLIEEADLVPDGGRYGMGYLRGRRSMSPQDWFFPMHFLDDPVMPGSLGVEVVLLGLQLFVLRAGLAEGSGPLKFVLPTETPLEWRYRGQILPTDGEMFFDLHVKAVRHEAERMVVIADGNVFKPGMRIYELTDLAVEIRPVREGERE